MSERLRWLCRVAALAMVLVASRAVAQTEPEEPPAPSVDATSSDAQALFRRGLELGTEDRWADALALFLRSRALVERPSTLFNIGVALGRLGRFRDAVSALEEFLALPDDATGAARAEAVRLRAEASAALAELSLAITPDDSALEVDGAAREGSGTPRLVTLDPGHHIVRARHEGYEDGVLDLSILAAEHTEASLALSAHLIAPPPPAPPPSSTSLLDDPVFWIVAVSATLAVGTAIGVGVGVATSESPPSNGGSTGIVLLLP